jgi:hypothetical protein
MGHIPCSSCRPRQLTKLAATLLLTSTSYFTSSLPKAAPAWRASCSQIGPVPVDALRARLAWLPSPAVDKPSHRRLPAACAQGFYPGYTSFWSCVACPGNTTTLGAGALDVNECAICVNGLFGTGPTGCQPCPANKSVVTGQIRPTTIIDVSADRR